MLTGADADCPPFFFFTVYQQFQRSEELHLSLDRSLRASGERMCLRDRLLLIDTSHKMEGGGGGIMSNSTESPFSCVPAAHKK